MRHANQPRPGDAVQITRAGRLSGVKGIVKNVYKDDVISIAISDEEANEHIKTTYTRNPENGMFETMCTSGEYELLERVSGVY